MLYLLGTLETKECSNFRGKEKSAWKVVSRIVSNYGDYHKEEDHCKRRLPRQPFFFLDGPSSFFDRASQNDGSICGVGALLKINYSCFYKLRMGCGKGSNTRGELLTLWSLVHFSYTKQVSNLRVYGDSKVIIDWVNGSGGLQVAMLHS